MIGEDGNEHSEVAAEGVELVRQPPMPAALAALERAVAELEAAIKHGERAKIDEDQMEGLKSSFDVAKEILEEWRLETQRWQSE